MIFNPTGTALQYPFHVSNGAGRIVSDAAELIPQSIGQILGTPIGSLPYSPYLGSRLHWLLYEPNDEVAGGLGQSYIREALSAQERRITVTGVSYSSSGATIEFKINYRVLSTGESRSMVYPFTREAAR